MSRQSRTVIHSSLLTAQDVRSRRVGGIVGQDESPNVIRLTVSSIHVPLVADVHLIFGVFLLQRLADEGFIVPFENHEADDRITLDVVRLDKLCKDEGICAATP